LRLAIITTHPIQYNAPLFRHLAKYGNMDVKVFYTWGQSKESVYDPGFGILRSWDVDLLEGYEYEFVDNTSTNPGSHHYRGIANPGLIKLIDEYSPDAILVYGWKFKSHLSILRYYHGKVPILFRGDSTLLDESKNFSIKTFFRGALLKWIYKHVDFALSPGTSSDAYFTRCGLRLEQIIRAPHAIDNEMFSAGDEEKKHQAIAWRRQIGIADDHKVFLFAGKLEPKKNPALLINAFIKLSRLRNNIHLIIVGNGILEEELRKQASTLQPFHPSTSSTTSTLQSFHSSITFLPFQNQSIMPVVFRLGDIFVLPSAGPNETWGLAINEAMASGKPVLVSNRSGGAVDLVVEGENGYVFQSENQSVLVEKMHLMLNQDLYKMGDASKEKIHNFTYGHFLNALMTVLNNWQ
jgi:glycosyltransferase involved in cell wall biosynthesis